MHSLTCVKYGAAALALGPAHSVTVLRGSASEYRICVSIIISAYGTTLCAAPCPLYCMHYNYMYCLIASRGGNVLCTLNLWACAYMLGRAYMCLIFSVGSVDRLSRSASLVIWCVFSLTLVGKLAIVRRRGIFSLRELREEHLPLLILMKWL